ncbi:DNA repair and recombination protein RAD54B [Armadillidium nasatum]|uniref:DNA repair and recombination protein RAD54-like n=1 Tax=Armadillidium nasatum TaxID=96803 RepID=A0A5N5T5R8_9CRUS|nr:DNA repair and recombination protein RAD54B [Armadillidium nasatum]
MRRSSAPSQLNKRRAPFFSPPYKNPAPASKRQCAILPLTDEPLNEGNQKRSSSELLTLIKTPTVADKENEPQNTSLKRINKVECTREIINNKFSNTFSSPIPHQSVLRKEDHSDEENVTRYFSVVWCKLSKKKHKNWEGDAVLIVKGRSDMEGKEIGKTSSIKLKDLESLIQNEISSENYLSGKCFQNSIEETPVETTVPLPPKSKPFRLPCAKNSSNQDKLGKIVKPLYNPCDVNAFILPKPPAHHQWSCNVESLPVVDVVVDPQIAHHLRPHQKAGVIFLYESAMGYRIKDHKGAILADEMGLGKTLQCIALIWTLLKQGPYGGRPVLKRVIIVTPSSLVSNWVRSIDKVERGKFDLILCDEGHRLKNCQIKTTSTLMSLEIKRRIIVTGTPIQNDLQELYSLIEFVNPGILGSSAMFRKVYEEPILKSQQPSATKEEKDIGESRALELNRLACQFTLRRTQEIINKYLPPKTEFVVFCQPSGSQIKLYNAIVGSRGLKKCLTNTEVGDHLSAICVLRKLCNHPALLHSSETKENQSEIRNEIAGLIPNEILPNNYLEEDSGKLAVVSCLLWSLFETKKERIVIVSNFTTTLDMLENLCKRYMVFLLSSKAGGVGLNLIGASRILLFDIDWNPATDLQAMSRVWRDGQTKSVYIYRLILAGSIEEKMFQRQVCKQGISGSVVDARSSVKVQFSLEDLKIAS